MSCDKMTHKNNSGYLVLADMNFGIQSANTIAGRLFAC